MCCCKRGCDLSLSGRNTYVRWETLQESSVKGTLPSFRITVVGYGIMKVWQVAHCADRHNQFLMSSTEFRLYVEGETIQLSNKKYGHSLDLLSLSCKIPPTHPVNSPNQPPLGDRMVWEVILSWSYWVYHSGSSTYHQPFTSSMSHFHSAFAIPHTQFLLLLLLCMARGFSLCFFSLKISMYLLSLNFSGSDWMDDYIEDWVGNTCLD